MYSPLATIAVIINIVLITGSSEDINLMLNNVHLQMIIEDIDRSSNPQRLLSKALTLPLFREFADKCLAILSNNSTKLDE